MDEKILPQMHFWKRQIQRSDLFPQDGTTDTAIRTRRHWNG